MTNIDQKIVLPSKPKIILEEENKGIFEIDGFYPGYGFTIGNSLRRVILSSLPGAAITSIKIDGVKHEFSTIEGVREDILLIMLNIKKLRVKMFVDEPQTLTLKVKGEKIVTGKDIDVPGQVEIINKELVIATLTDKNAELNIEMTVERGLGFVTKDNIKKDKVDVGTIILDANFTPIRRVSYEVENMRVGDRTDFNRLRISIETDGSISPRDALVQSINIMISQLKAITGFEVVNELEEGLIDNLNSRDEAEEGADDFSNKKIDSEFLKTRIESLNLSARTQNALSSANIRTLGGLVRKKEKDILEIEGLGAKGVAEIKRVLGDHGITLK